MFSHYTLVGFSCFQWHINTASALTFYYICEHYRFAKKTEIKIIQVQNPQTIFRNPAIEVSGEINEGLQPVVEQHTICTLGSDALQIQTWFCKTTQEIASID